MENQTNVIILSGGIGKRFWPISTSKSLFPVVGKPIIEYLIDELARAGFSHFVVVTNPLDKMAMDHVTKNRSMAVVVQQKPTGMADALLTAAPLAGDGPCLVVSAHDFVEPSLVKHISDACLKGKPFFVGKKTDRYFDGGYYKMDGEKIVGIIEKPGAGNEPSPYLNLVYDYFPHIGDFIDILKKTKSEKDDIYEKALDIYLSTHEVDCLIYDGFWQPLKYPWHVLDLMEYVLHSRVKEYRGKNVEIKSDVIIEGPVHIEDNVRIFEHTKIIGPCYIGKNTIIGNNNLIRTSHIADDCVTGFNTDISRSYIGSGCWFHSNYIGDSVLEENVSMGSGSVLANLRLDESEITSVVQGIKIHTMKNKLGAIIGKNVRIGVNTSIMPGIKIGQDSLIGAGIVVSTDIEDGSYCTGTMVIEKKKNQSSSTTSRDEFRKRI